MKQLLLIVICLCLWGCISQKVVKNQVVGGDFTSTDTVSDNSEVLEVDAIHLPDQWTVLKDFRNDIIVLKCHEYDNNTAPISISGTFYTVRRGWIYTNGKLSHTISAEGLTEGVLILDFPADELRRTSGYFKEDKPYIKMNLYRNDEYVSFQHKKFPIDWVQGDTIFCKKEYRNRDKAVSRWVFVGKIPLRR